jgi:excisionase family DNA binding protein
MDEKLIQNVPVIQKLAYTVGEAAQSLGVSVETVYRLLSRGLLKSSSALRHKVIPVTEIQRFLNDTLT